MADFSEGNILDHIQYPDDLRQLPPDKLGQVCSELRQYIIDVLSENPGHLGASLGTVELTVALHYVFSISPTSSFGLTLLPPFHTLLPIMNGNCLAKAVL